MEYLVSFNFGVMVSDSLEDFKKGCFSGKLQIRFPIWNFELFKDNNAVFDFKNLNSSTWVW